MESLERPDSVLRNNVLFVLVIADVVRSVREKVNKGVRDKTNQVHCLFLSSYISWQSLFNDLIKCG